MFNPSASMHHACRRAPGWFRYGVVAMVILMLCSCSAPVAKAQVVNAFFVSDTESQTNHVQTASHVDAGYPQCAVPHCMVCQCGEDGLPGPADEYLCDGGDYGLPAAVRADWKIDGLEQEDTIAHYDTIDGRTVVTPSNRVCIYAPRFNSVRQVVDLRAYEHHAMPVSSDAHLYLARIDENERATTTLNQLEPGINRAEQPPSLMKERLPPVELANEESLREYKGTLSPYCDIQVIRSGEVSDNEAALVQEAVEAAITWTGDEAPQVTIDSRRAQADIGTRQAAIIYHEKLPNNPRLRLIKLASCCSALPGEEVEFTLRFDNIGDRVMGNVTIVDNLTTRLEYIKGSARSSLDADFTAVPNEQGSDVLRWEIKAPLEPRQGGILQFRARVR